MPFTPATRLPGVGTTIFSVMSQLAAAHDAINLSQGYPDFDGPPALRQRLQHHVDQGRNQYAPMAGIAPLREQIAAKVAILYGRPTDAEGEVTVTPGATAAIYCAITALVRPGDEVIVFDPAYDSYVPAIILAGGVPVRLPLQPPAFAIDWTRLADALNPRTRLVIVNFPHNPSGAVLDAGDLERLAELLRPTATLLLADEVYEHLVYDGRPHASVLGQAELAARALVVSSFGKTYHVTGWKTGYCVAPPGLTAELRKVHQFVTFVAVTPIQWALADFMADHPDHVAALPAFYQAKRDLFCARLADSRFRFTPTPGTYFQLADYAAIADVDDLTMARRLTTAHGVAAIPVSVFYADPPPDLRLVRFCFAKEDATLDRAAQRLCAI